MNRTTPELNSTARGGSQWRRIGTVSTATVFVAMLVSLFGGLVGCTQSRGRQHFELSKIYDQRAQLPDSARNPVIVIPGILGSKLIDSHSQEVVWGELGPGGVSPRRTRSLTELALPMQLGSPLDQLRDQVAEDGPLDQLTFKMLGIPIRVNAYAQILAAMGVGGYRDQRFRGTYRDNEVNYGADHFTCFQFAYDWRRDISESAALLHEYIEETDAFVRQQFLENYGLEDPAIRFDIVAHSMGGLVARYYLRYGNQPLPADGSLPVLNWAGAQRVGRVFLIGTPNAGSAQAIVEMKEGMQLAPPLPKFPAAVIGTMPAAYQLLPRTHTRPLVRKNGQTLDVLAPETWEELQWGLADPKQDKTLRKLLPDSNATERRRIALEHQFKCLVRARQLHDSLDLIADPPATLEMHLYAGDAEETLESVVIGTGFRGQSKIVEKREHAGDGTVTRASALWEEDTEDGIRHRINWRTRTFLSADHLGLTRDRAFVDNVLSRLLEPASPSGHSWAGNPFFRLTSANGPMNHE